MTDRSDEKTRRRRLGVALGLAAVGLVVAAGTAVAVTAPGDRVLDGVRVAGEDVAGLTRPALEQRVHELADERHGAPVVVEGEREQVELTRGDAGLVVDHEGAIARAWEQGRGFPDGWWERLAAPFGATVDVPLREEVDVQEVRRTAADLAEALSVPPRDADLALEAEPEPQVEVTDPALGERVDADALADGLGEAVGARGAVTVDAPGEVDEPVIGEADLEAAEPRARTAISGPVVLEHPAGGDDLTLEPADLADVLTVERRPDAPEGERLALTVDPEALAEHAGALDLDVEPVEARIELVDGAVEVQGGTAGYRFDADAVAEQVLEVAVREDDRSATLAGPRPEPDLSAEEAEDLGISEEVASFTTEYECCPPRVTNIQRIAELVDGALVPPGTRFSLNDHAGPRTEERGFVAGGAIIDGELEDVVGGGTSQFATTFFNAAFFTGVELVAFQPHSYYFPRYPPGRESTISYGVIDVVIENDSPYGILLETAATDTSVTVAFWSSPWAEVEAFDSGRYNVEPGAVRDGFDIDFGRIVTYPDGTEGREEWFHRYEPQD